MSDALQNAAGAFGRLSAREQMLVAALAGVLLLLVAIGITVGVGRALDRAERRLEERKETLSTIESLEGRYRAAEQEQAAQRSRLQHNTVQLFSLLQKTASELGLKLDNLNERTTPFKESGIQELSVDVTLKDLSITKLNKVLEKLEGGANQGLVKVNKLKVKTGFANEEVLDVNLTVCTYKLLGAAAADEPEPAKAPGPTP